MDKKKLARLVIIILALVIYYGYTYYTNGSISPSDSENVVEILQQQSEDLAPVSDTDSTLDTDEGYTGPRLPDINYNSMNIYDDGYEVVKLDGSLDGDTARFQLDDGVYKVRFLAVDTPESDNSPYVEEEPWGIQAKKYTSSILQNADVIILESDDDSDLLDNYDRMLAWIWVDGELLNYTLVDQAYAEVKYLYGDYKYTDALQIAQSSARNTGKKIWGEEDTSFTGN